MDYESVIPVVYFLFALILALASLPSPRRQQ